MIFDYEFRDAEREGGCFGVVRDGNLLRLCRRKGGHGKGGKLCRQHAAVDRRIRDRLTRRAGGAGP